MKHVFKEAECAVTLVKFGRFTADFLAFAAADGCIRIASTGEEPAILQARAPLHLLGAGREEQAQAPGSRAVLVVGCIDAHAANTAC